MKVLLVVSLALPCAGVLADHHKHGKDNAHNGHDHGDHDHDHHHGKGKDHDHKHHRHSGETMSCHKIAPFNAQFAFEFYRQVAADHPSENIFFSPVSISTAFSMLSLGAKGQTLNQIIEGLGFNTTEISEEEIHNGFQHLLHMLNDPDSELQLNSGNALFIDNNMKLIQKFLEDVKEFYESEAFSTDFHNTKEATKQINSYVEKKTHGKITDLLKDVDERTLLILINYIYFRGKWEKPFEEEFTQDGIFHVDENTNVTVPMMRRNGMYNVAFDDKLGCTVVQIPYKGNATSLFILPDEGKLKQVEEALEKSTIMSWKKLFGYRSVDLTIPKFSVSAELDLVEVFKKFGVKDVFSDLADLTGIAASRLKVSKALHKAVLSIDEKGTEAAAATAFEIMPMMIPPNIKFNQPFLITIYDQETRSTLFLGRITNPKN
ncbi:serpin peptidase inhibitor, clade A (alpha-1 antiproteinase, antitrypsin), member 1 S homeolog precursor [Xenopus laevis]|uniref:Serpin peptidase inhibitor, clade A (Alpha-1 antiproteinase, antitrypsin), member 1 S homeolog precursor n=1 Tax=Xenopus laevis TaxID=8355 RepID=Q7SYX0_XENLA|nr:serpin peptidase inhibitor, clade A (alpha-1 antiproteinase, antitrypsin), member 1 S homeolog precursor [Xenopus laevis]AAH54235.1 Serpina1d-prov protein [Xenopus laevis]